MEGGRELRTIGLLLALDLADELPSLSERFHVWAVDSPTNRAAAVAVWQAHPGHRRNLGVTLFTSSPDESLVDVCLRVLADIDLHHGELSECPPYQAVEVFGRVLSDELRRAFGQFGLTEFSTTPEGFRAHRRHEV